jgi:hypothetical protein
MCFALVAMMMVPFAAFAMDVMADSDLEAVTGRTGDSAAIEEVNMDQAVDNIRDDSSDSQKGETIAVESNTDRASNNLFFGPIHGPLKTSSGVSIWVNNVNFDLYIACTTRGDFVFKSP